MKERYKIIRTEIRKGICSNIYRISHNPHFHHHQVKVIDTKTEEILWFCNKCLFRLAKRYRDIAHELTQRDRRFWSVNSFQGKSVIRMCKNINDSDIMEELNGRKRRFDETFRTLLIIVSITTTFSFNLYKDALGNTFFFNTFVFFIFSIVIWAVANLVGGYYEYTLKLMAWHFLIFDIVVSFTRLILGQLLIPQLWSLVVLFAILFPTIWIKGWLQEVEAIPTGTTLSRSIFPVLGIWTVYQILWITMT